MATPTREGFLMKRSRWLKEWRRRYIVLRGRTLTFAADAGEAPHGEVDLRDVRSLRATFAPAMKTPFLIELVVEQRRRVAAVRAGAQESVLLNAETVLLASSSAEERDAWLRDVEDARSGSSLTAMRDSLAAATAAPRGRRTSNLTASVASFVAAQQRQQRQQQQQQQQQHHRLATGGLSSISDARDAASAEAELEAALAQEATAAALPPPSPQEGVLIEGRLLVHRGGGGAETCYCFLVCSAQPKLSSSVIFADSADAVATLRAALLHSAPMPERTESLALSPAFAVAAIAGGQSAVTAAIAAAFSSSTAAAVYVDLEDDSEEPLADAAEADLMDEGDPAADAAIAAASAVPGAEAQEYFFVIYRKRSLRQRISLLDTVCCFSCFSAARRRTWIHAIQRQLRALELQQDAVQQGLAQERLLRLQQVRAHQRQQREQTQQDKEELRRRLEQNDERIVLTTSASLNAAATASMMTRGALAAGVVLPAQHVRVVAATEPVDPPPASDSFSPPPPPRASSLSGDDERISLSLVPPPPSSLPPSSAPPAQPTSLEPASWRVVRVGLLPGALLGARLSATSLFLPQGQGRDSGRWCAAAVVSAVQAGSVAAIAGVSVAALLLGVGESLATFSVAWPSKQPPPAITNFFPRLMRFLQDAPRPADVLFLVPSASATGDAQLLELFSRPAFPRASALQPPPAAADAASIDGLQPFAARSTAPSRLAASLAPLPPPPPSSSSPMMPPPPPLLAEEEASANQQHLRRISVRLMQDVLTHAQLREEAEREDPLLQQQREQALHALDEAAQATALPPRPALARPMSRMFLPADLAGIGAPVLAAGP